MQRKSNDHASPSQPALLWCCAVFVVCTAVVSTVVGCGGKADDPKPSNSNTPANSSTAKPIDSGASATKTDPTPAKPTGPTQWGTLKGRFVYDGKAPAPVAIPKVSENADAPVCCAGGCPMDNSLLVGPSGGLANVVVYLRTKKTSNIPIHPDSEKDVAETVELDNLKCMFHPHMLVMRTSQTLDIKNSDTVGHNTNIQPIKAVNGATSQMISPSGALKYKFKVAEYIPVVAACNIHPWMKAYILPRDDPYATVSAADGTFEIKNVPAGSELEFQLWHERPGYLGNIEVNGNKLARNGRLKITLKPGENDLGKIKVPPAKLVKK